MELILTRIAKKRGYTIGRLSIKASPSPGTLEAFCDTLEPTWRDYRHGGHKMKDCSAIPEGRYAVVIVWSPKREKWLPLLLGVPLFSDVRIHPGTTAQDTEGGILVGQNLKKGMVLNSNIWLHRLKRKIVEAKDRGEAVWLTIR